MRNRAGVFVVLAAAVLLSAARAAAAPVSVSVSFFHDQLAPHGRWVTAASYGNVWIPGGITAGWEPYVDGEWVYSDYGWTWMADDPWGDIPYHYGTWALVEPYGWVWIPGTVWAPAWVTWAYTDDFIGWAPVPPSFALSVTGYFGPPVVVAATRYVCVPARQFVGVRVASVRVPQQQSVTIVQKAVKTTRYDVHNGIVRVAGPPQNRVERAIGRPVQRVSLDRLRAQPTSLAAGGVVKTKRVSVVAPEQERARLTTEKVSAKPSRNERSEPKAAPRPEAPARAESVEKRESAPKASKVKPESTSSRNANAPENRAKPEPRKPDVERSQPEPKPKAEVERSQVSAKPKAKPESRAVEPREQSPRESAESQRPKPEPQVQKRSEPKSSVSREQAAQKQQPKPKSKPQPPPSREKEKPQKDSSDSRQER